MKRYLFLISSVMAYLLLCSKSCSEPELDPAIAEKERIEVLKDSIISEFESESLSRGSFKAFEMKARQKLVDFGDYLRICNNKSMDDSFKSQARLMIRDLFISDSIRVNTLLTDEHGNKMIPLNEFLRIGLTSSVDSNVFSIDSVKISIPLHRTNEDKYTGTLQFSRYLKTYPTAKTTYPIQARMEAEIVVTKVDKIFGADTVQVWQVLIGNIK